ncbi:MAG: ABC transporter permease [Planctomycetes bacterium]|nr:ABC transporter permease [Planctomycetota bacterium]
MFRADRLKINWVAFETILIKEIVRVLRIWPQTIIPPVITTTLYFIIFGKIIGSRVGTMGNVPYMEFIVPGLVMMSVINNSYSNVVSSFFGSKFQRNVEEMMVAPMHNSVILLGYVAGGVARAMIVGFAVALVSLCFVRELVIHSVFITVTVALATATLFSIGGFINALLARKFDDVAIIPTFVLTPLTYLGGVFYSINLLPPFWRTVSRFNPIVYMVNAFRYGILKDHLDAQYIDINIVTAYGMIVLFTVGLFMLALWMLNKGIGLRQ